MAQSYLRHRGRSPFFHPWYNAVITAGLSFFLIYLAVRLWQWAVSGAVMLPGQAGECMQAAGACWSILQEKWRLILFGFYPQAELWRAVAVLVIVTIAAGFSSVPRFWSRRLPALWMLVVVTVLLLLSGGILGLPYVSPDQWSGLPLTVVLSLGAIIIALPLGILLALARQSEIIPLRAAAVALIELVRGIPLVTALFVASVVLPLFLPAEISIPKIIRALFCIAVFLAAYVAEAVRAGLQWVPGGQREAAAALGFRYWRMQQLIILPQALRVSLPGLINAFLDFLQATSLVVIIGLFDLLGTTRAAIADTTWQAFYLEAYLGVAAIYFVLCFSISKYSGWLETYLQRSLKR
ncbi:amino acid ABC transporter permease [Rhizobium puerariae]|uniref:Amino acid ABC transporter permease n=1 Tax=Rhizobium puerariae TaxID=1585791 RepID=A0ABV6AEK1_9HYPH